MEWRQRNGGKETWGMGYGRRGTNETRFRKAYLWARSWLNGMRKIWAAAPTMGKRAGVTRQRETIPGIVQVHEKAASLTLRARDFPQRSMFCGRMVAPWLHLLEPRRSAELPHGERINQAEGGFTVARGEKPLAASHAGC